MQGLPYNVLFLTAPLLKNNRVSACRRSYKLLLKPTGAIQCAKKAQRRTVLGLNPKPLNPKPLNPKLFRVLGMGCRGAVWTVGIFFACWFVGLRIQRNYMGSCNVYGRPLD